MLNGRVCPCGGGEGTGRGHLRGSNPEKKNALTRGDKKEKSVVHSRMALSGGGSAKGGQLQSLGLKDRRRVLFKLWKGWDSKGMNLMDIKIKC